LAVIDSRKRLSPGFSPGVGKVDQQNHLNQNEEDGPCETKSQDDCSDREERMTRCVRGQVSIL